MSDYISSYFGSPDIISSHWNLDYQWELSMQDLVKASGVSKSTNRNAQIDLSKTSTDLLERIVYVLKKGSGQGLPSKKRKIDRIGFADIVRIINKKEMLNYVYYCPR